MATQPSINRVPEGMKLRAQWALAGASKAPLYVNAAGKLVHASVTEPSTWMSWDAALYWADQFKDHVSTHKLKDGRTITQTGLDVGFVLHEDDEFTILDFDVKNAQNEPNPDLWTTQEQLNLYWRIAQTLNSYTEYSRSGLGLHVIVRGSIGAGFRRDGVEIYSQERFIICTGNVLLDNPVEPSQDILDNMVTQMRAVPSDFQLVELEQSEDDQTILNRAASAGNGEKFLKLWAGDLPALQQEYGFPSQSEADLALVSMLAFYSKSNEQCRRIFRMCKLGQRAKATKNDRYLNYTLEVVRERQAREERADVSGIELAHAVFEQVQATAVPELPAPVAPASTEHPATPEALPAVRDGLPPIPTEIRYPPGKAGEFALDLHNLAVRPVKEIAIAGCVSIIAGVTGKAWHIPGSGLNLYTNVIARSGVGKEALHSGASAYVKASLEINNNFAKFIDFTEYASGQAITKACVANPSFLNISGEWGRKLRGMSAEDGKGGPLATLMTYMLNAYQKSGPASIIGGIGYSSVDNNVASIQGVNYSFAGETTPQTFYRTLTDSMMEDGFQSRFLNIEYRGERPDENENRSTVPRDEIVRWLCALAQYADGHILKDISQPVEITDEAKALLKLFNKFCDQQIRSAGEDESRRQLWNRAALMSYRIAGGLAVFENWIVPVITYEQMYWAIELMQYSVNVVRIRLLEGDVGTDDHTRERKLFGIMRAYLRDPIPAGYKIPDAMRQNSIIPRQYMQIRIQRTPTFSQHRFGANKALDDAIATLLANGYLMEVQKDKVVDGYNFHGKAYRIIKLPEDF